MKTIIKIVILISAILINTGCEKSKEYYENKLKEYLINNEGYKVSSSINDNDLDYKNSSYFIKNIAGDGNSNNIYNERTLYYKINTENLTFHYFNNDTETGIRQTYTYDYKTDIVRGSSSHLDKNKGTIKMHYTMMYNFSSGNGECLLTENVINKSECSLTGLHSYFLMNSKSEFINIIDSSGIEIDKLYSKE